MKSRKSLFLALTIAFALGKASAQNSVPQGMELTAHEWCQQIKAGWNLGNTFESCDGKWNNSTWEWDNVSNNNRNSWETAWGNPAVTTEMIQAVKDAGFNAIRIPVRWLPHIPDRSTMTIDPVWMARIKEVVDICLDKGLYVIINTHHELWLEYNPYTQYQEQNNEWLAKIWTQIGTTFANYDGKLAFAGINEVVHNGSWQAPSNENTTVLNSYNKTFVETVRALGGKNQYRNLIVQTYSCNPDYGLDSWRGFVIPTDVVQNRLSVEFHYYQPWDYCGSGSYYWWGEPYKQYGSQPNYGTESQIKELFSKAKTTWWDQGYGVVVGEYGCVMHYQQGANAETQKLQKENTQYYYKFLCNLMKTNGFAGFAWDNNALGNGEEQFGIFDRKDNMKIKNTYAMTGIIEGCQLDVETPEEPSGDEPGNEDPGSNDPVTSSSDGSDWYSNLVYGQYDWSGEFSIAWSSGLYVSKSHFANLASNTDENQIVVFFEITDQNESMMKFCYDDSEWKAMQMKLGTTTSEVFQCASAVQSQAGKGIMIVNIPATNVSKLQSHDLVIHGVGAKINRVIVVDANKVDQLSKGDANADHKVSISDVVDVVSYLNMPQKPDWLINVKSADVTNPSGIEQGDVVGVANLVLEKR